MIDEHKLSILRDLIETGNMMANFLDAEARSLVASWDELVNAVREDFDCN